MGSNQEKVRRRVHVHKQDLDREGSFLPLFDSSYLYFSCLWVVRQVFRSLDYFSTELGAAHQFMG